MSCACHMFALTADPPLVLRLLTCPAIALSPLPPQRRWLAQPPKRHQPLQEYCLQMPGSRTSIACEGHCCIVQGLDRSLTPWSIKPCSFKPCISQAILSFDQCLYAEPTS